VKFQSLSDVIVTEIEILLVTQAPMTWKLRWQTVDTALVLPQAVGQDDLVFTLTLSEEGLCFFYV